MTAKRPALQLVAEGNPGHRPKARLEGGVKLAPTAPPEPDWREVWPAVRVPTIKSLQAKYPVGMLEGAGDLVKIEDDVKRIGLAKARQRYLIGRDRDTAKRAQENGKRARHVARTEWRRIVPILDEQGLLATVDATVLADHCVVVARIDELERDVSANGTWTHGERGAVKNPAVTALNQYRTQLRWSTKELGLTPLSRDAMPKGRVTDGEDDNPFG